MKKIYLAQLERFGYMLTAVGTTKKQAVEAIMETYTNAYLATNGIDPAEDMIDDNRSYSDLAREEIYVETMTPGECHYL